MTNAAMEHSHRSKSMPEYRQAAVMAAAKKSIDLKKSFIIIN